MNALPERVLLATDGSEDARYATRAAVELQARSGVEPHVAHVWRDVPTPYARAFIKRELSRRGQEILDAELAVIRELGGEVAGPHLAGGRISDGVLCLGERVGAGHIVLDSRGLGMVARARLGSAATKVVRVAPCPVLVYAPSGEEGSE